MPARYVTLGVLAGAYKGGRAKLDRLHTHCVLVDDDSPLEGAICRKVAADNLADVCSATDEEQDAPPTCPRCLARDPRFPAS